jgi:diguanylate cyclase (GGDEF)-like protein
MQPALAELIDTELRRHRIGRRTQKLVDLYENSREELYSKSTRISLHIAGIVYISFAFVDAVLISDVAASSITARFVIGFLYILATEALIYVKARLLFLECHCALATVIACLVWLCIAGSTTYTETFTHYLTYSIVFMLGLNVFFSLRFSIAATSSTVILIFSFAYLVSQYSQSIELVIVVGTLYLSTYALTLFVNWKLNQERYLVFLNSTGAEIRRNEAIERGAALLRLSTTDALTGLANRRAIDDALRAHWSTWQAAARSFAVVLVDVDYFKLYNDHYGHQEGDKCLVAIAKAMSEAMDDDMHTLGRFGGEEFILILRTSSREHLAFVSEKVRRAVEAMALPHIQRPDSAFVVTVSVGAALSSDVPGTKVERLVTEADRALYNAKNDKRNCVKIYDKSDPNHTDIDENLVELVRTSLAQERLSLVYQPIRHTLSGQIAGVEALMRFIAPTGKNVSPAIFIPIAERTGTIIPMGLWAIYRACRDILSDARIPMVSVNVSPVQLRSQSFALSVAAILSETGVMPNRLAFEITEGLQIEGQKDIIACLTDLRSLGVKIWLDDFGTGFAGLSCVREVQFDAVKIDRSFLHATSSPKGQEMFRSIVTLVRNTGCAIVVEGVETSDQLSVAAKLRVDYTQGYHLGRPLSVETLRELLESDAA